MVVLVKYPQPFFNSDTSLTPKTLFSTSCIMSDSVCVVCLTKKLCVVRVSKSSSDQSFAEFMVFHRSDGNYCKFYLYVLATKYKLHNMSVLTGCLSSY